MSTSDMSSPYRGLTPYTEADAPYFFGRAAEIVTTAANLEVARLTIFYGPSGVGKSSVLRAGVLHHLWQQAQAAYAATGCAENIPVYFNRWPHDPLVGLTQAIAAAVQPFQVDNQGGHDISQVLSARVAEEKIEHTGFAATLRNWTVQTNSDLLLMLDQFEEYFLYHTGEIGPGTFAYELVQAVNSPLLRVNFLLSLREDTLARLDYFKGQIPFLLDNRLSITHLHRAAGREAVTRPLDQYNRVHGTAYTIDPALVEGVLDQVARGKVALARQGAGLTAAEAGVEQIESPYLQLVLTRLWEQEQGQGSTTLRLATLDALGGAEKIVSNYLDDTMASLSASHQAIAARFFDRLITIGGTKIALSLDELIRYAKADATEVQQVLQQLQTKRLLRGVQSSTGATQYEIFHDVLAQAILAWQSRVPWRTADRYLEAGLFDWREAKQKRHSEILLDHDRYLAIWSHKEAFGVLSKETNEFLVRTALCQGEVSFSYWLNKLSASSQPIVASIVQDYVIHPNESTRHVTETTIIQAKRTKQLADEIATHFVTNLWATFGARAITAERESMAKVLWAFRDRLEPAHLFKVLPVVLMAWMRAHRTVLTTALASSATVFLIFFAIWFVREQLRGSWQPVQQQLFAGPISALALSPTNPDTVYLVTPRGPAVEEGATLLRRPGPAARWEILKRDFTHTQVAALTVVEMGGQVRIYASLLNEGIIRSDDEGQTWRTINNGLLSFSISSLFSDPFDPNTLYAGSIQQRGIFESQDGGDTWRDINGKELFGLSISAMTFTKYDGGALIVATDDGRVWAKKRGETEWRVIANIPGIGKVVTMAAEPQNGQYIYAGTSNGTVLRSENGAGFGWQPLESRIPGVFIISSIVVRPRQPNEIFLSAYGVGGNLVWQTKDFGHSWQTVADDRFSREQVKLYIHPAAPAKIYAAGQAGFFETSNSGDSWVFARDIKSPLAAINRIAISPVAKGPTYVVVSGDIYVTADPDQGAWVRGQNLTALTVNDVVTDPSDPNKAYAAVHLPNKWSILQTTDGGKTWQLTRPPSTVEERYLNYTTGLEIVRVESQTRIYAGTNVCGVVFSEDSGKNWETFAGQNCLLGSNDPRNVIDLTIAPDSPDTIYVAADSTRVYRSTDRGKTWKLTASTIAGPINAIKADSTIPGRVYLIAGSAGFWRSDNGAETWQSYSVGLENKYLIDLVVVRHTPEILFVASSDGGVWKTVDGGRHWRSIREDLATAEVSTLVYDERRKTLLLGSWQHGLHQFQPGSIVTIQH